MKLAVIVPGGVDPSGTHRVIPCLLWLLERITPHHDVCVFAMRGTNDGRSYELCGATVHSIPGPGRRTPATLRAVLDAHRRGRFDVLQAFWVSGPGVVAGLAGLLLRRPVLLHIPGGDLVALPDIGYGGRRTAVQRMRVSFALAAATVRTAPSRQVCDTAARLGYPAEQVPLGVSRDAWVPTPPRPRDPGEPARLVHVGSLNRVKDHTTLLRAARRLADAGLAFTLDMVGTDTLDGRMQRLAQDLGIVERTRFHGFLPQERLRPLVAEAHLMLVSSRHEAGPVAVAEAAMVAVPTVGTAVGLLPEWAPEAAAIVPIGDDAALAAVSLDLLRDDERRLRIGAAARARALARDADWSARQMLRLYDDVTPRTKHHERH
jgi:glycosyltransferase involved in cell wall biosynthesis